MHFSDGVERLFEISVLTVLFKLDLVGDDVGFELGVGDVHIFLHL